VKRSSLPVKTLTWQHFLHIAAACCNTFAVATTKLQCEDVLTSLTLTSLYPQKAIVRCSTGTLMDRGRRGADPPIGKTTLMTLTHIKKRWALIRMT
jgi:hypothetical protein